jgi:hypothetical protein
MVLLKNLTPSPRRLANAIAQFPPSGRCTVALVTLVVVRYQLLQFLGLLLYVNKVSANAVFGTSAINDGMKRNMPCIRSNSLRH